jgi:hypothetical protein
MNPNSSGQATAVTVLTPIFPDREAELSGFLRGLTDSPLAAVPSTHFARWVVVGDFKQGRHQLQPDVLKCRYLLFTSNVDGPVDAYLEALVTQMPEAAATIWSCCIGCPTPATGAALADYLRHNLIDNGFFYSAYPRSTVADVRRSLNVRQRLHALILRTQDKPIDVVRREFLQEFVP